MDTEHAATSKEIPVNSDRAKITVPAIRSRKATRTADASRIVALTAYDYTFARLVDLAGVDIVLVGDSLGMVVQGESTTLPVTLEQMIYHTTCVARGVKNALVVADMPFLSYQVSLERAIESAGRLIKEGNASAVKLEGGVTVAETVRRLTDLDIPVMGHVGMTPQSVHRMGGFRQQGRSHRENSVAVAGTREQIIEDAKAIEQAGAFSIVLEGITGDLAETITRELEIPTIGIAAGRACDGEILVAYDLLGFTLDSCPPFVKNAANLGNEAIKTIDAFASHVRGDKERRTLSKAG